VALVDRQRVIGVCEQERITRVRAAGFNKTGLPDEALDTLLERLRSSRAAVAGYATAEPTPTREAITQLDHHLAHACASYLSSPAKAATIVVCDDTAPNVSVWQGRGAEVTPVEWPWRGPGFAHLYTACAAILELGSPAGEQRFEAFARLLPDCRDDRLQSLITGDGHSLDLDPAWETQVSNAVTSGVSLDDVRSRAAVAAALQARVGELFVDFLNRVQRRTQDGMLCVAGSFFYHSSINTLTKCSGAFSQVFVPVDPGDAGLAVGAALRVSGAEPQSVPPFLGPAYDPGEITATLDNCKLRYDWVREEDSIMVAVDAVTKGKLVGWFDGAMEWGPRALGARCILGNPFAPHVLENLNRFLKHREPWRGYALSGLQPMVHDYFRGPDESPFMECDYRPQDVALFKHIMPSPEAAIRVQTVNGDTPVRFRTLLATFQARTSLPFLVNTSFNGFHEPIVCSPRDAVRVFYGSGLDVLILDRFVVTKE
jgi:carbamoyltransferase